MSRDGAGIYVLPAIYEAVDGNTATAAQHNTPLEDLEADANLPRPVVAGGTGASTASGARTELGVDPGRSYSAKSSNYTAVVGDKAKAFRFTASATLSLDPAATLGNGWWCSVRADGGNVTIDPNSSEQIDGATTITVFNGMTLDIICNGIAFFSFYRVTTLTFESTDDGAVRGPILTLLRNSASPAVNDFIGSVDFNGKDSAGGTDTYARIMAVITDPTSGSEDGDLLFQTAMAGSSTTTFALAGNQARFFVPAVPTVDDGASLGTTTQQWSDLFVAPGGVINFANGDVTVTHSTNSLTFAGATNSYRFDSNLIDIGGASSLGTPSFPWSNLAIKAAGTIAFGGSDVVLVHSTNQLDFQGAANGYVFDNVVIGSIQVPTSGSFNAGTFSAAGASRGISIDGTNLLRSSLEFSGTGNHLQFFNSAGGGAFVGRITTAATATAYNTSSDETWKDFLGVYDPLEALAVIRADPTRKFTWKTDGTLAVGWGAQTSYAVSHDLATPGGWFDKTTGLPCDEHDPNAEYVPWGVDQGKRTPYLWAVVPWLADRLDAAEATIAALEARIAALEAA